MISKDYLLFKACTTASKEYYVNVLLFKRTKRQMQLLVGGTPFKFGSTGSVVTMSFVIFYNFDFVSF